MTHWISLIVWSFVLLSSMELVDPAKILFLYAIPFPSHYRAFSPLIDELAKRGHQITAYTGFEKQKSLKNYTEISINIDKTKLKGGKCHDVRNTGFPTTIWRSKSTLEYMHGFVTHFRPQTELALQSKELQALMQSQEKFDLLILEANYQQESLLAFGHKFNVPVVNLFPIYVTPWMAQLTGLPHSFSYIPDARLPHTDRMSFFQRTRNMLTGMWEIIMGTFYYLPLQESWMRRYFNYPGSETLPTLQELMANVSLHLIDSHPLINSVRPYSPNVVDVAGMHIKRAGKPPQDLQTFMDEATEGVIYFNFGSFISAKEFSEHFRDVLIETMKGLKQRVIMRWNEEIDNAPHILTGSWLPQLEILAHPNCKLFITHGGYNGLMEAVSVGVPTLGIPFFADQYHNLAYLEQEGVSLELGYETITVAEFREKIGRIIRTPTFKENAKRLAAIFWDLPQTSLERAVYWVEYVIRHKGAHHLKPASVKMPYYQYLLLDVVAFLAISIIFVVYILYYFASKIVLLFEGPRHVSQAKKRK